jgi:Amt family ammonium transporter
VGTLALGFIALPVNGEGGGLFYGGGIQQLIAQTVAVLITLALSGLMTAIIGLAIHKTIGFRVSHEDEVAGVDRSEHAESAYEFGSMGHSQFHPLRQHIHAVPAAPAVRPAGVDASHPDMEDAVHTDSPEAAEELHSAPAAV